MSRRVLIALIPLAVFAVLVGLFYFGLKKDPTEIPSPLINMKAPSFSLEQLDDPTRKLDNSLLKNKVTLLNVWGSWCVACHEEQPMLMQLSESLKAEPNIQLIGMNWKDTRNEGLAFLKTNGNPFSLSLYDPDNHLGLDLGVYGAPETFIIDQQGVIRFRLVGIITTENWRTILQPVIAELQAQ